MYFANMLFWQVVVLALAAYGFRVWRQYDRLKAFKGPFGTGFSNLVRLFTHGFLIQAAFRALEGNCPLLARIVNAN